MARRSFVYHENSMMRRVSERWLNGALNKCVKGHDAKHIKEDARYRHDSGDSRGGVGVVFAG